MKKRVTKERRNNDVPQFSKAVCENLKQYVYALADPNGGIFYVGKGHGNRVFQHIQKALMEKPTEEDPERLNIIRKIYESKQEVQYYILRHGIDEHILEDEDGKKKKIEDVVTFELESLMIDFLRHLYGEQFKIPKNGNLTNIQAGHYTNDRGIMTANDIQDLYHSKRIGDIHATLAPYGNVLAISINKSIENRDIYEAVRYAWKANKNRVNNIDYVLAVANGRVEGVFVPKEWKRTDDNERFYFDKKEELSPDEQKKFNDLSKKVLHNTAEFNFGIGQPLRYFEVEKIKDIEKTLKPYGNVLAISINRTYKNNATEDEVYKAVRSAWKANIEKVQQANYVVAVAKGFVRGVFIPEKWKSLNGGKVEFFKKENLEEIEQKKYEMLKKKLINKAAYFGFGSGQPLKYFYKTNKNSKK